MTLPIGNTALSRPPAPSASGGPFGVDAIQSGEQHRRRSERHHLIQHARILADGRVYHCVALDLSESGVRVYLLAPGEIPARVELLLPDGTPRQACRRWRRDREIGFEFLRSASEARAAYPLRPPISRATSISSTPTATTP